MPDNEEPKPVEASTEPAMLPAPTKDPLDEPISQDEQDLIDREVNRQRKAMEPPPPPGPPAPPKPVAVSNPAPWLWWVAFGALTAGITLAVYYSWKARRRETSGEG